MDDVSLTALAAAAEMIGQAAIGRETMRTRPGKMPTDMATLQKLDGAYEDLVRDIGSGRKPEPYKLETNVPEDTFKGKLDAFLNTDRYGESGVDVDGTSFIRVNPNADRSIAAHEMGHVASRQTDLGRFISNTRNLPALRNSIAKAALLTVPAGAFATLNPGDDDIDEAMVLSALVASPTIADEILATKNGLDIMNRAGMQAKVGQRAKLAGGLLTYLAAPLAAGGLAANVGNIFDEDVVMMPE